MNPIAPIALVVCIIFVVALLKLDRQCSPNISKAFWIPTIWFLYCSTRPLADWFIAGERIEGGDNVGGGVANGSFLDRYFLSILFAIGIIMLVKRTTNWSKCFKDNAGLVALLTFMLISIFWSDFMFVSFKRWIRNAGTFVMALVVMSEADPREAIFTLLRRGSYVVIPFSAMLVKYYPRLGIIYGRWSGTATYAGATMTKNNLGESCAIWLFLYVWILVGRKDGSMAPPIKNQKKFEIILLFLTLYLMKGPGDYGAKTATYSATSIVVLLVGLLVFFGLRQLKAYTHKLGKTICIALAVVGGVGMLMTAVGISPMGVVAPLLGRQADLTGRTDLIWDVLLPIAQQNPLLGMGFGSFWIRAVPGLTLDINEAHNGYLDVYLELGITGLILIGLLVISYFRKARKELDYDFDWGAFRLSYLAMYLLHNWTETTLLRSTEMLWCIFVILLVVHPESKEALDSAEDPSVDEANSDLETETSLSPTSHVTALCFD